MGIFDQNGRPPRRMDDDRYPNGPQRPGSGLSGRLILALVIAFIGLLTYWNQIEENPVTHQKQHVAISPDQEIRLGLQSAPEMARKMGGEVPDTDPKSIEVRRIGELLVNNTDAKKSPWKFKFHLLSDTKTINAFALPGGQIFITLGLLNDLETEAQLAGVLSHEMGHVIERHTAQQMAKSQLGDLLVAAVVTGATDPNNPSRGPAMIAGVVNHMIQLRYGRKDESQADMWGLILMNQVGYDPRAMVKVMQILKKAGGGDGSTIEMFQTHPNPDLRIEQINAYLKEHPPSANVKQGRNLKELWNE
jgi:predicted Zn-dependent protease